MDLRQRRATGVVIALTLGFLAACSSGDGGDAGPSKRATTTTGPAPTAPAKVAFAGRLDLDLGGTDPERCDPIAAGCLLPFPNDHFTVADDSTPTGRRVHLQQASMPANAKGVHIDPEHWNELDGFSPGAAAIVQLPDVDLKASGAAPMTDLEASLDARSPVVLLDATARKVLPHWVELDAHAEEGSVPMLAVHPATALPEGHRIVVALRHLVDGDGEELVPTDAFRAYRDRLQTKVTAVEDRRLAMEQVFADLGGVDVERKDLLLAWDFTVASADALSGRLLHIRDDAFDRLGDRAPAFRVLSDEPSDREGIAREVSGSYEVPLYLDQDGKPGSSFVLGDDGLPTRTGTYAATFRCIVPEAATKGEPGGAGLYGHGLLGTSEQVGAATEVAVEGNRTFCATDLIGMAEEDLGNAAKIVSDFSTFNTLADRLQQGHLNTLVLGRLMIAADGLGSDPAFQDDGASLLTDDLVYYGISQGGIMGAATTAVAQDWTTAVLGVPAANYSLLLDRSVDFDDFRAIMEPAYPKAADRSLALQLIQMLWDRGEATGYLQHLTTDPYQATPKHRVLLHAAYGDHQVANVATGVEARAIGARLVEPVLGPDRPAGTDPFWAVPGIDAYPYAGSAVAMWDSGAEVPPLVNLPPRQGEDPHGDPRADPAAIRQIVAFLADGKVIDVCRGEPCTAKPQE